MGFRRTRAAAFLSVILTFPALGQQASNNGAPPVQRDPQGLDVLSQVINAAGGLQVLSTIHDFTATGSISYNWGDRPVEGSALLKSRGLSEFRMDATLPDGMHSWVVTSKTAVEKRPDGSKTLLPSPLRIKPATFTFPVGQLLAALQDASWSISYIGLVTHNGRTEYEVSVRKVLPANVDPSGFRSNATKADFFIDTKTYTVLSIEDRAYSRDGTAADCPHEIQFSNYQQVNGILVPFTITELIGGSQTVAIQLNQIVFGSGLTDSDFAP